MLWMLEAGTGLGTATPTIEVYNELLSQWDTYDIGVALNIVDCKSLMYVWTVSPVTEEK